MNEKRTKTRSEALVFYETNRTVTMIETLDDLHLQDRLILIEALTYWAYDVFEEDNDFDRSDPRRNRGAELAQELLRTEDIPHGKFGELIDPDWSG